MPNIVHGVDIRPSSVSSGTLSGDTVIGIVGTAPKGAANTPILITTPKQALDTFGSHVTGATIPRALETLFRYESGKFVVINTYDGAARIAVAATDYTFAADKIQLPDRYINAVVVQNQAGTTTYVLNTDYSVNTDTGIVTRIAAGAIAAGATVRVSYSKANFATVTPALVAGGVNPITEKREGLEALIDVFSLFGLYVDVIIAPSFSSIASVAAKMGAIATQLEAKYVLDAPSIATLAEVLAGRNGAAPVAHFGTTNPRAILCYPNLKHTMSDGTVIDEFFSTNMAGAIARTERLYGYGRSPSNQELVGVTGFATNLYASTRDANSDISRLNRAGIVTYRLDPGNYPRTWGNYNASYDASLQPPDRLSLINIITIRDKLGRQLEARSLPYADAPLNPGNIDAIETTGMDILATQPPGTLMPGGRCTYRPDLSDIPNRHLVFSITFIPVYPIEVIEFQPELTFDYSLELQ
jgi:phage tail sheath protein FI